MSTSTSVIGLGGYLRSGKDTVADYLVAKHGYTKMGMSDALLDVYLTLDPIVPATSEHGAEIATRTHTSLPPYVHAKELFDAVEQDYTEFKTNSEVRRSLQVLGTEIGRNMIDPNLWVNIMSRKIAAALERGEKVAVTGIRFPNELDLIAHQWKGATAWVHRGPTEGTRPTVHASENSVSVTDFNYLLVNNGTLEDLYGLVEELISEEGSK